MSFSPNLFLSHMRSKDGPAKPSRFEVVIPIPDYISKFTPNNVIENLLNLPNSIFGTVTEAIGSAIGQSSIGSSATLSRYLALQCEAAELPGRTLMTQEAKVYGPTYKVPYQTQYNEMTLTFLCTNEFWERKLFDRWLEAIMPSDTNNMRYAKGDNSGSNAGYMIPIKVIQYDDFIKQIYAVELIDAFPIGISAQALSWSEDGFHRLSVQFAYQKYKPVYTGSYDIAAAAAALFGVGLANISPFGKAIT
jgi:hypothetical protein